MVTNLIVCNIILDILDVTIITYRHVMQADMMQGRMDFDTAWQSKQILKDSYSYGPGEMNMLNIVGLKFLMHPNVFPIISYAVL